MTDYSQNGYLANDPSVLDVYTVPGSKVRLRLFKGAPAQVLLYLAARFDNEVEDIDTAGSFIEDAAPSIAGGGPSGEPDDWSTAFRTVRGSSTILSNHASGTAIDLNATQHPRGVRGTFTAAQVAKVRAILARLRDPITGRIVVRWGEDYVSAPTDGMHFEINADLAAVTRVAALLNTDPISHEEAEVVTQDDIDKIAAAAAAKVWRQVLATADGQTKHSASTWLVYTNVYVHKALDAVAALQRNGILTAEQEAAVKDAITASVGDALADVELTLTAKKG